MLEVSRGSATSGDVTPRSYSVGSLAPVEKRCKFLEAEGPTLQQLEMRLLLVRLVRSRSQDSVSKHVLVLLDEHLLRPIDADQHEDDVL